MAGGKHGASCDFDTLNLLGMGDGVQMAAGGRRGGWKFFFPGNLVELGNSWGHQDGIFKLDRWKLHWGSDKGLHD